jgi:hypothetical protein
MLFLLGLFLGIFIVVQSLSFSEYKKDEEGDK